MMQIQNASGFHGAFQPTVAYTRPSIIAGSKIGSDTVRFGKPPSTKPIDQVPALQQLSETIGKALQSDALKWEGRDDSGIPIAEYSHITQTGTAQVDGKALHLKYDKAVHYMDNTTGKPTDWSARLTVGDLEVSVLKPTGPIGYFFPEIKVRNLSTQESFASSSRVFNYRLKQQVKKLAANMEKTPREKDK